MELNGLDKFKLITYQNLDHDERNVFTLLYQPLIGCDAFTLYLTLWSLIERARLKSPEYMHYKLYDIMRCTPKQFLEARRKLEAIGLLVAYSNDDVFLYELMAPLTAEGFIKDGSLGAYLFSRVGAQNFEELTDLFRISKRDKEGYKNISTAFDDVFESIPQQVETKGDYISRSKGKIQINHPFDFDVFLEGLSKNFVDKRKVTKTVKEKIMNIAYVYNLDEFTMQKAFMDSVDKDRNLDLEKLSRSARDWFDYEKDEIYEEIKPDSKEVVSYNDLLDMCLTETPAKILAVLSNGKPSSEELKVIEKISSNFDLDISVINFMVVYIVGMLESFPKYGYFDKVAVEWQRNRVTTINEAITLIKQRETKIKTNQNKQQQSQNRRQKNVLPKDIESDWLDDYLKKM